MKNESSSKIVFLVLIAGRNQKDDLLAELANSGVHMITTTYGKGAVKASYLMNLFGLVAEEHKVVMNGLLLKEKSDEVLQMLVDKFHFDKPNTGIAFTTPTEIFSFK